MLNGELQSVEQLFDAGNFDQALALCLEYLIEHPNDVEAIRMQAKIQGVAGRVSEAIESITKILSAAEFPEPCDFFYRGRWFLREGKIFSACSDFQKVLKISEECNDDYYVGATQLHLAYAYALDGNKKNARVHLNETPPDSTTSVNGTLISISYIENMIGN